MNEKVNGKLTEEFPHEDIDAFGNALHYTAKQTGFVARLIEKDYYCSLILSRLYAEPRDIISPADEALAKLAAQKMTLPEPLTILLDTQRKDEFRAQIETQLKPVLRDVDFKRFDFDSGWAQVSKLAEKVIKYLPSLIFIPAALLLCQPAFAGPSVWLSGAAGPSLLSESGRHTGLHPSISPFFGAEAAYNIRDVLYVGGFYDLNLVSVEASRSDPTQKSASLHFFGPQARVRLARPGETSSFMDIKVGPTQLLSNAGNSRLKLGFGVAYSYEYPFSSALALGFRLGYRLIHYEFNAGEMSLGFLESTVLLRVGL